jgi:NADH-quinone oxidoreductase E subunit
MKPKPIDWEQVHAIIARYKTRRWGLIPLLQEIQETCGYIPPESIEDIAEGLDLYPSQVQGVITFYSGFSLVPKGKCVLKVCRGTACHVRGSRGILRLVKKQLGLEEGQTTPDYQFTLETVACLGACFLAPTMMVNRDYFGRLTPPKVVSVLDQYGRNKQES